MFMTIPFHFHSFLEDVSLLSHLVSPGLPIGFQPLSVSSESQCCAIALFLILLSHNPPNTLETFPCQAHSTALKGRSSFIVRSFLV